MTFSVRRIYILWVRRKELNILTIHSLLEMPSQTHKAFFVLAPNTTDYVTGDTETPKPNAGEILVKVHAAALNPVDWKAPKYNVFIDKYPAVLGADAAGEVVQLGEGVNNFAVGDRV